MEHSYGFTLPFRGLQGFGMTCNALRIIHSNMLHVLGQNIPPIDVQVDYSASNKSQIDKMIIFLYFFLNFQVGVPHERCRSKMLKLHSNESLECLEKITIPGQFVTPLMITCQQKSLSNV